MRIQLIIDDASQNLLNQPRPDSPTVVTEATIGNPRFIAKQIREAATMLGAQAAAMFAGEYGDVEAET